MPDQPNPDVQRIVEQLAWMAPEEKREFARNLRAHASTQMEQSEPGDIVATWLAVAAALDDAANVADARRSAPAASRKEAVTNPNDDEPTKLTIKSLVPQRGIWQVRVHPHGRWFPVMAGSPESALRVAADALPGRLEIWAAADYDVAAVDRATAQLLRHWTPTTKTELERLAAAWRLPSNATAEPCAPRRRWRWWPFSKRRTPMSDQSNRGDS